jgi:hypothetical protein
MSDHHLDSAAAGQVRASAGQVVGWDSGSLTSWLTLV